jgi:hypothetical protein
LKQLLSLFLAVFIFSFSSFAQQQKLVQLSGLVLTSDSLMGIPFATVLIKGTGRGTITDYQGFFSLVAPKGDKIEFSCLGHKKMTVYIPDTLSKDKYSVIQLMTRDTFFLPETQIFPWPSKEQFKQAFLSLNVPDDDYERAKRNLERERLKELGQAMPMDANENVDYFFRKESYKYYYYGQVPPMNIFNPLAWAKFIEAWKNGDFKRKDKQ